MDSHDTRRTLAPMYARLGAGEADVPAEITTARRLSALVLALLVAMTMPLYWAASASAGGSDEPAAPLAGKSGSGDDDDDDDDDDQDSTDGNGRSDGAADTRGTDGAGDTRGTVNTDKGDATDTGSDTAR